MKNIRKQSIVLIIVLITAFGSFNISSIGEGLNLIEENKILEERIFTSIDEIEYLNAKELIVKSVNNSFNKDEIGRNQIKNYSNILKNSTNYEVFKMQSNEINNNNILTNKQKKSYIQINKIIAKYIKENFGINKNNYNLDDIQRITAELFISKNEKIAKLQKIIDGQKIVSLNSASAASWENCDYETNFPDWATYKLKTYYGYKANWVGRTATDNGERYGINPCDFSFYLENPRISEVDGWSIATECAVKWSNGISIRRYGWNNMKAIIGHGRLTLCGTWSFNTEMLRDQIRFY